MVTAQLFYYKNGLRQGENLPPILFSLSLNDLESFLLRGNNLGMNIFNDSLQFYLKFVFLLYADDMDRTSFGVISLKGGCTGSSESTLVKMANCWKSHVMAQMCLSYMTWCMMRKPYLAFVKS